MTRICVFCGSKPGNSPRFQQAAEDLGRQLVGRGHGLVYGGAAIGLTGIIADAVMRHGGEVIGVIPDFLSSREIRHEDITSLETVQDMHSRKARMASLADAFVALPGGFGTLEEFFEIVTWAQLRLHHKPIGLLNTMGFFDPLIDLIDRAVSSGFIHKKTANLVTLAETPSDLLNKISPKLLAPHSDSPNPNQI